jgi:hypothetical protein
MSLTLEHEATYCGFVRSTYNALILFEACMAGLIRHVTHRLQPGEPEQVIRSGRVFISESGFRRWTNSMSWSPSRLLDDFLIYRQVGRAPTHS